MNTRHTTGRKLVAEGGNLNTRLPGRTLKPESPSRPEIQEEIRLGLRTRKGKVRSSSGFYQIFPPRT